MQRREFPQLCIVEQFSSLLFLLQNNSTKSMQFHAVVQELYSKRNLRNNTPKKDNLGPSQNKVKDKCKRFDCSMLWLSVRDQLGMWVMCVQLVTMSVKFHTAVWKK